MKPFLHFCTVYFEKLKQIAADLLLKKKLCGIQALGGGLQYSCFCWICTCFKPLNGFVNLIPTEPGFGYMAYIGRYLYWPW
jgi:hypothetical protein